MGQACSTYEPDAPYQHKITFPSEEALPELSPSASRTLSDLPPFYNTTSQRGQDQIQLKLKSLKGTYKGEGQKDVPHGNGCVYFQSGAFLEGIFVYGICKGPARHIFPNGHYFVGTIEGTHAREGQYHDTQNGIVMKGSFENNRLHGEGEEYNPQKGTYKGSFQHGLKHGHGIYQFKNEDRYEGEFRDDHFNGQGTLYFSDSKKYSGEWKNGQMQGQGSFQWPDGQKYTGGYNKGMKDGYGTLKYKDGTEYEGNFKQGQKDGRGILKKDGRESKLVWKLGTLLQATDI